MKVMAIGTLESLSLEQQQSFMPREVPATLQVYLDGKIEQFWLRDEMKGPIFLMEVESLQEASDILEALPLGKAKLLSFELMPIGPLSPLGLLIQ
ncbi:hypothetical protein M2401_002647 [Pseudomonas sp. JUb42]|uniref:hypothetical protein n=1 Tax=Pseudomonas sp. JUb42 TaxID=2940611 RepID=UPI002169FA43|nr:hypothetical protein [Pseudomonas sp. JUb42]MCS3468909.1 hypothetical protein [Pseudomonas sp. JUb42]